MKTLHVSDDIIPIGEFKTSLSKWLKKINKTGHPLVITQNGRPAGVLISPSEYDELIHKKSFIESINRGLSDVEKGNVYTTQELKDELNKRRETRSSNYNNKINELKNAMKDKLFLSDLKQVSEDFKNVDLEEW